MPVIRAGEPEDLDQIAAIQAASPEAARWDVAGYLAYDLRVCEREERVAGFLVTRSLGEGECELLNLAVAPEFRRQGVGRELMDSLLAGFRGDIFLEVRESNGAARTFYKYLGFREFGRREQYYSSPAEAAIVMKFHSC